MDPLSASEVIFLNSMLKNELQSKYAGTLFYVCISGAHLYGIESPDSDVDVRGVFVTNTHNLLGLREIKDIIEEKIMQIHPSLPIHPSGIEIVLTEIAKETSLALKSNCNALEHLTATPLYAEADALEWRNLLLEGLSKDGIYNSYKGLATFNYHKFLKTGRKKSVKKYLYVFRGLLAGMYALQNGIIEPDLNKLARCYQIPEVNELIKLKSKQPEQATLPLEINEAGLDKVLVNLFEKITKAYEKSSLPNRPDTEYLNKVNSWLIKLRKNHLT